MARFVGHAGHCCPCTTLITPRRGPTAPAPHHGPLADHAEHCRPCASRREATALLALHHGPLVDDDVCALHRDGVLGQDGGGLDVCAVVEDEEGVRLRHDVRVDRDSVEVLLEDRPQVSILGRQRLLLAPDGHFVEQHLVVPLEELVHVVPLLDRLAVGPQGVAAEGVCLGHEVVGDGGVLLGDDYGVEGEDLLAVRLELAVELRVPEDGLGPLLLRVERRDALARRYAHLHQARPLLVPHLVHPRLELLKVPRDLVPLLLHQAVAVVALLHVASNLHPPVRQRVLQPLQPLELRLDRLGARPVLLRQVAKLLRPLPRRLVVGLGGVCKVVLESLDLRLEHQLEHVPVLEVLVLELLAVGIEVLLRVRLRVLELLLDELDDVHELALGGGVLGDDVGPLRLKVVLELPDLGLKLALQLPHLGVVQVNQRVHVLQVAPQRHLVLLLRLVQVAVEHLDDGVLHVDLPLVVL
mmetsp:Transcript_6712/g.16210  ORF Transcript_6712/g.16210 Transcript_6712/m.16210 type:complete len:469 (+) Transcript_6712:153-1559(+)